MAEKIDLRPLKPWLQRGEIAEICEEIGICPVQASNIISGRSGNFSFVKKFLQRVETNKALVERSESLNPHT